MNGKPRNSFWDSFSRVLQKRPAPTVPAVASDAESPYKKSYDHPVLDLFETPIGNYILPNNAPKDIVINSMKFGKVFEPEVVHAAQQYIRKGTAVLDIGANFGQMSMIFSKCTGPEGLVYAFEADDYICNILNLNIEANHIDNITIICKAVYHRNGESVIYPVQDFKTFDSYGSYGIDPNATEGRKVETITIDSLNIQSPISFMKIDVQGSDLFVMKGAFDTIRKHKMPIIFEYEEQFNAAFHTTWQDYIDFIDSIRYRIESIIYDINYIIVPK